MILTLILPRLVRIGSSFMVPHRAKDIQKTERIQRTDMKMAPSKEEGRHDRCVPSEEGSRQN